ncbi:aldose epimerase family protein [Notoacmeibacter ruber]|uniref:Galactose mutarotase n=1 Tax=Notoacmeibacter ruber TaxID=2670375 RepID=A0A3L7JHU8_9HYPH|nr:aldose epimerase family protein [Notoacmeibacter ruber]RLQ89201.1 galactose mutarotase [Notoacmeibacter ruber]
MAKPDTIILRSEALTAMIVCRGAALYDLRLVGHPYPLVLSSREKQGPLSPPFAGAVVGRFANRIADARFQLDGVRYNLDANDGPNCLHGGRDGLSQRDWTIEDVAPSSCRLSCALPDGHMGFPGTCETVANWSVEGRSLRLTLSGRTDAPTIWSPTAHPYFNLADGGATSIDNHTVQILAGSYLPVDANGIPAGEPATTEGSPFDFRQPRPIGDTVCDHNFCLHETENRGLADAARLSCRASGVAMRLRTDRPGLQFYTGDAIPPEGATGLGGIMYGPRSGLCLETQIWPDAPNRPDFPEAIFRPEKNAQTTTEWVFETRDVPIL